MTSPSADLGPLALFDLDDTLSDRAGAFTRWAERFVERHGIADPDAVPWMVTNDDGGYRPRDLFFMDVADRFDLPDEPAALARDYALTAHDDYQPDPALQALLRSLIDAGWRVGIVTNGGVGQQVKIEKLGIEPLLRCEVISGLVGVRKPDPRIFELAIVDAGGPGPDVPWMVGDHPGNDIVGAQSAQLRTLWIDHGRTWDPALAPPDVTVADLPSAVAVLLGQLSPGPVRSPEPANQEVE